MVGSKKTPAQGMAMSAGNDLGSLGYRILNMAFDLLDRCIVNQRPL